MRTARARQDEAFWSVVQDLHWRLDDRSGGGPPPDEPEFDHGGGGGGGVWPVWATHLVAFLLGGICFSMLLIAPVAFPVVALLGLVTFTWYAARHRWR